MNIFSSFIEEKRRNNNTLNEQEFPVENGSARTSPYPYGQEGHIKSYIVDNQEGALSRYMSNKKDPSSSDYFEERLKNVENTLGIISLAQYPSDMYARLKIVEDKIMRMEELYPQISAHLLNYQDRTDNRLGGRITRAPGFYKELLITKKKKKSNTEEAPISVNLDAAQASDILKSKMEDLKNKLMK